MSLQLFDTFTRTQRTFAPLEGNEVRMYCCGPTVYNFAHIGNLRTYLFEDFLRRVLEFNGFSVRHVVNITDVGHLVSDADDGEDKMEKGSRETGKTAWEIAEMYTKAFQADIRSLNIVEPTIWCRATDHIQEQIDTVQMIENKGLTYRTSDGIYFDTAQQDDYGFLARLDKEGLQSGMRVDMGEKRNPTDFALWKFSPAEQQRQMEWESPWGIGFPGWHIECSAMSAKYLGTYFDIHCGGEDHISVHHSNEIAQTQAAYGTRLANFWVHGYFLQVQNSKMSKSSGEFLRLQLLAERGYDPLAYRFLSLGAHYRTHLTFSWESLDSASTALGRLRNTFYSWVADSAAQPDEASLSRFREFVNDDLNVPRALALTWDVARSALADCVKRATLLEFDRILGLDLASWKPVEDVIPANVRKLAEDRQQARQEKRWADADTLRKAIAEAGYDVKDTNEGPQLTKKRLG